MSLQIEYNHSWIKITGNKPDLPYIINGHKNCWYIPNTPYNMHYLIEKNEVGNKDAYLNKWRTEFKRTDNKDQNLRMIEYKTKQKEVAEKIRQQLKKYKLNFYDFLYDHQVISAYIALKNCSYGLFLEQGTGKTLTAIQVANIRLLRQQTKAVLIVCPANIISIWEDEFASLYEKYGDEQYKPCSLTDQFELRLEKIATSKAKYFIVNYDMLKRLYPFILKRGGFNMVIFDESTRIKNGNAQVSKAAIDFSRHVKYKLLLTGTPIVNTPMDLHNQIVVLQNSSYYQPFNTNFFAFRNKFFTQINKKRRWGSPWIIKPKATQEINGKLYTMAIRYTRAECLTLPPLIFQNVFFDATPEQKAVYTSLKEKVLSDINSMKYQDTKINIVNALAMTMKLPQVTTGFMYDHTGKAVWLKTAPKINMALELIEEINDQVVIFGRYQATLEKMKELLKDKAALYYGKGMSLNQKNEAKNKFIAGKVQVLLVQLQSGSLGLNLQENCSTAIFMERDYSPANYDQAVARLYRSGQKNKTIIYNLMCRNTIDIHLLNVYKQKIDVASLVLKTIITKLNNES